MNMEDIEPILKRFGWTVECESPLEIRHKDGSFASNQAAKIVIEDVLTEDKDAYEHLQDNMSDLIGMFEEDTGKVVGCFLFIFNEAVAENQLLELSPHAYEFIPSDAQILAPSIPEAITRHHIFQNPNEDDEE